MLLSMCLLGLTPTGSGAVAPLPESAKTVLADVTEGNAVLDEAGLYALLSNVARWEGDAEPGARIPDYAALRAAPDAYRGQRFLVRGRLHARVDFQSRPQSISRPGWRDVQLWQIQTPAARDAEDRPVLVYLLDAPLDAEALAWFESPTVRYGVPRPRNQPVEVVGRFYKHVQLPGRDGEQVLYPVFVGDAVRFAQHDAAAAEGGRSDATGPAAVIVALLVLLGGLYALFRFGILRRREPLRPGQRWREQRSAAADTDGTEPRRQAADAPRGTERADRLQWNLRDDLPDDPVDAMAALESEHDASRDAEDGQADAESFTPGPSGHQPWRS